MSPTPPSTSSSTGAVSPEGHFRVIRKRNRVPLSCGPCRHRKLKCNRAHPCENCVKRGDAHSCSYAQTNARKRNSPQQSAPSTPDDMQNRIDRLEGLVLSLMTNGSQSAGPAAAMAAISRNSSVSSGPQSHEIEIEEDAPVAPEESDTEQVTKSFGILKVDNNNKSYYISDAHWASVLNDISEVRNYFNTHKKQFEEHAAKLNATRPPTDVPGSALLFGAMKPTSRPEIMSSLPSKYTTDILIARYFNSYDPATHILHGPAFQAQYNKHWEDPSQTCIVWIAMLFAMMRLAMLSYYHEGDEPPEFRGKSLDMAGNFRNLMSQCLTLADYTKPYPNLIEALVFHLHGDFSQTQEANVSIWVLVGVITRLAMRMGYHRDPKMFPNITPFQGEMRRRVWTFVRQADLLFSFQVGLPSMIRSTDSDTELPRNLYDDDFDIDCKELPPSRPPNEPTPVSYLIAKARLTYVFGRVIEHTSSVQSVSYDKVMEIDAEIRRARDLIPEHLMIRPLEDCRHDPANLIMSRFSVMSVYHKAECVLHRRYLVRARENHRFAYSRRTCIDSAMELLRFQSMLHQEIAPMCRLRGKQSRVSSLSSADFLLATTIVCLDLHHGVQLQAAGRASGDTYAWGRERRDEMLAAIQRSKEIWEELRDESMDAWKASGILSVMLGKLNLLTGVDANAAMPAFEPQDEKQSAAMTLGLLSSGMSPMNSGLTPFNDPAFKMSESPLPQGGLGAGEIPGAPSPFSSMFGQMPDMQVNVDWDAWDTYIQNSSTDASNQWWPMMDLQQQQQQPIQSPLSPTRMAAAQTGIADETRSTPRFPTVFPHGSGPMIPGMLNTNPPEQPNGGARGQGMPFSVRRAALRLLSSPVTASSRTTPIVAVNQSPSLLPFQLPSRSLQSRWQSDSSKNPEGAQDLGPTKVDQVERVHNPETPHELQSGNKTRESPVYPEGSDLRRLKLLGKQPRPKETLYIGNLFYDVTAEDLRRQMEKFGIVENVRIVFDNRGISKGFGYVKFDTVESAERAIEEMHLQIYEGRPVTVQFAQNTLEFNKRRMPPSRTLFIGNIAFDMTDRDLNSLFRHIHNVIDVRVSVDRRTGQPRGFAHAEFIDIPSAQAAFEILSTKAPYGRKLRVDFSADQKMVGPVEGGRLSTGQ